jgi:hypothetical protein
MYTTPVLLDTTPHVITSLLAMGMALSFIIADRSSPTSRALSLFLASVGLAIGIGSQIAHSQFRKRSRSSSPMSGCCECAARYPRAI